MQDNSKIDLFGFESKENRTFKFADLRNGFTTEEEENRQYQR